MDYIFFFMLSWGIQKKNVFSEFPSNVKLQKGGIKSSIIINFCPNTKNKQKSQEESPAIL